jgi:hypothetical protein
VGGLNNRHLFLLVLEAKKSKIKVVTDLVSDEDPLFGLTMAIVSTVCDLSFLPCVYGEKKVSGLALSLSLSLSVCVCVCFWGSNPGPCAC